MKAIGTWRFGLTLAISLSIWSSCSFTHVARAEEFHSNGVGGGDWSDPASWREKKPPGPGDDAVISRGDVIEFDRNDEGKTSCKQIFIDPKGVFAFKSGVGRVLCCVGGQVEAYGTLKIDGTRSAADKLELRLVADVVADRRVKIMKGGSLAVSGRRNLAHGKHNVAITTPLAKEITVASGTIEATPNSLVDVQRAQIENLNLFATQIDNTGAKVNERINIVESHFTGLAHLTIYSCDSPLIAGNLFEMSGSPGFKESAILIVLCPLAEIRDNTVRNRYGMGIQARQMVDSALVNCTFEGMPVGVYWYGTNGMLKGLKVKDCYTGITTTSMSGVLEDIVIDNCATSYSHAGATAQLTNVTITNLPKDGVAVSYASGPLTLLNCNVKPEQVVLTTKAPAKAKDGVPLVECLNFLVVGTKGKLPAGALVELKTAQRPPGLAPNAADPNVRNSPARILSNGLTPLPQSLEPLIAKAWIIDDETKVVPAPKYTLSILAPATETGAPAKTLVSQAVTPDASWYRPESNSIAPTVEVKLP